MNKHHLINSFLILIITVTSTVVFGASEKTAVPLFLFSGQSNMVGMGSSVSALSGDQKSGFKDIKIYLESEGSGRGKWLDLEPGYGGNSTFGPELFFGKKLIEEMPDVKMAFIKDARSGTYLGQASQWLPPSSGGPGPYYKSMMDHIESALKKFNDAYDTSEYTPKWAGFIWHQGEFDAMDGNLANKYEENLTNLINDIREMAEAEDLPAIIPMIDAQAIWSQHQKVRDAEVAVAAALENCDTMETKGLPTDGIHYKAAGMVTIGEVCAERWLAMDYTEDWWVPVPVVYRSKPSTIPATLFSFANGAFFDLSGRKVPAHTTSSVTNQQRRNTSVLMLIRNAASNPGEGGGRRISKVLNLQ